MDALSPCEWATAHRLLVSLPQDRGWRGLVQTSGSLLSHRLPTLGRVALIWPARTGRRFERGVAQEGNVRLEVAVPSQLEQPSAVRVDGDQQWVLW